MNASRATRPDARRDRGAARVPSPGAGRGEDGRLARFVGRREVVAAQRLIRRWPSAASLLWLPCRDAVLAEGALRSLPRRIFLADYRASRLERVVRDVREAFGDRLRARAVDVPMLEWADGVVDVAFAPGVLSRLAVPADRRLFLVRLAGITRLGLCVSARVAKGARRPSGAGSRGSVRTGPCP
jgi:hypothetical protein